MLRAFAVVMLVLHIAAGVRAAADAGPSLAILRDADATRVVGQAPDAAAAARLQALLGGADVSGLTAPEAGSTAAPGPAVIDAAVEVAMLIETGRVAVGAGGLAVVGLARSSAAAATLEALRASLTEAGVAMTLRLHVPPDDAPLAQVDGGAAPGSSFCAARCAPAQAPQRAWARLETAEGRLVLTGQAPDAAAARTLTALARARFGADAVQADFAPGSATARPGWLRVAMAAVDAVAMLRAGRAEVADGVLTLRGVGADAAGLARADAAARDAEAEGWRARVTLRPDADDGGRADVDPLAPAACLAALQAEVGRAPLRFETGAATLDATASDALDVLAATLARCGDAVVVVEGHTDDRGDPGANQRLSAARAQAVRAAMIARGARPEALAAVGLGAARPIADNADAEGRARNRRIAFSIAAAQPATHTIAAASARRAPARPTRRPSS